MSQNQKAGAGSKQIQVYGNYYDGVTEERAAEIARAQAIGVLAAYSEEAAATAAERIAEFGNCLIQVLSDEGVLDALGEPAFQVVLRKAQVSAAATDNEEEYDILARLLGERAKRDIRPIRASIDRAVQVVDSLDESALQGLCMNWTVRQFLPVSGDIVRGMDVLNSIWGSLPHDKLPAGRGWLDHLDMLNLARYSASGASTLKKMNEFLLINLSGYFCPGLSGEEVRTLAESTRAAGLGRDFTVVPHIFKPGSFRMEFPNLAGVDSALKAAGLAESDHVELLRVAESIGLVGTPDPSLAQALDEEIGKRDALRTVRDWWDQIPQPPELTGAGIAVAYVIARRYKIVDDLGTLEQSLPK